MLMDCWIPRVGFSGSRCEGIIGGEMEGGFRGDVFVMKVSVALLQVPMVWWPFVLSTHLFGSVLDSGTVFSNRHACRYSYDATV